MKKCIAMCFAGCLAVSSARAGDNVSGVNFVVSHPTTISAVGAFDGGSAFTSIETVGIFSEMTGDMVGDEVVFGPGHAGTQVGEMFYEKVPLFVLSPGDYSIVTIGAEGGSQLSGGNGFQNLGNDLDLPGGGRFNSGTTFDISLDENTGSGRQAGFVDLVDPPGSVPDGGMTSLLLGASLAGLSWVRRKF